jgi:hypothetical protein
MPFRRSRRNIDGATEFQQRPRRSFVSRGPRIVKVAAVKDREVYIFLCISNRRGLMIFLQVIFTAPPPPQKTQQQTQSHTQGSSTTPPAPGTNNPPTHPKHLHSLPVRLLAYLVLFICCTPPHHANANTQSTQRQQGQPQGQIQAQASRTQLAAPSTSTTPAAPAPAPSNTGSGAATMHSRPLPLRARFVLFLCCASPSSG